MADTLRSICALCTHLNNPQLNFVPEGQPWLREILMRDLNELVVAASAELEKAVVVLTGATLETVLFSFIQSQESYIAARRGEFTFDPRKGLEDYKNIFNRWFRDVLPNVTLPDSVVDYRNLVHVNQELNFPPRMCSRAAREMLRILDALLGELALFVSE